MEIIYKNISSNGKNFNCIVSGINADLISWLLSSGKNIFDKVFSKNNVNPDELFLALGLRDSEDRRNECKKVIEKIWNNYGCFGPYKLLDHLYNLETKQAFYPEYRDHIAHQLYVFL